MTSWKEWALKVRSQADQELAALAEDLPDDNPEKEGKMAAVTELADYCAWLSENTEELKWLLTPTLRILANTHGLDDTGLCLKIAAFGWWMKDRRNCWKE